MAFLGDVEYRLDKNGIAASVNRVDCMENQEVIESSIPARFKVKPNWKKICEACPFRDY